MKFGKLFSNIAAVCLLAGTSNAAMAVGCPLGFIANETVDEIRVTTGGNCLISDVVVLGDVIVRNGLDVLMRNSKVLGNVRITDSANVILVENQIVNGNVIVSRANVAYILDNTLVSPVGEGLRMVVREISSEGEGFIFDNEVDGRIVCRQNSGNVFARSNIAISVRCPGQIL